MNKPTDNKKESLWNHFINSPVTRKILYWSLITFSTAGSINLNAEENAEKTSGHKIEETRSSEKNDSCSNAVITDLSPKANKDSLINADATPLRSPWEIVWDRESAHEENPIGCISSNGLYYGAMQGDYFNASNTMHYGLLLGGKHKEFALQFYNTKLPGFDNALKKMEQAFVTKGNAAFIIDSKERKALLRYVRADFKTRYKKAGLGENKDLFLNLQTKYFNAVFVNFPGNKNLIDAQLKKQGINFKDVNPAIVGMWLEHMIAKGNAKIISKTLTDLKAKGGLDYLNSKKYVTAFKKYRYKDKNGKIHKTICDNPSFIIANLGTHTPQTAADINEMTNTGRDVVDRLFLEQSQTQPQPAAERQTPSSSKKFASAVPFQIQQGRS